MNLEKKRVDLIIKFLRHENLLRKKVDEICEILPSVKDKEKRDNYMLGNLIMAMGASQTATSLFRETAFKELKEDNIKCERLEFIRGQIVFLENLYELLDGLVVDLEGEQ